jgi:hypothetical protein
MLDPPPLPHIFSIALAAWCILDVVQVVTAHSTEHWVIAHIFFTALCVALVLFFHGTLRSDGVWGQGIFGALPAAAICFAAVIGLCIYMLVSFEFDQSETLERSQWVLVEYITATLITCMHVGIGLALPAGLVLNVRTPLWMHMGGCIQSSSRPLDAQRQSPKQPELHPNQRQIPVPGKVRQGQAVNQDIVTKEGFGPADEPEGLDRSAAVRMLLSPCACRRRPDLNLPG